MLIIVVWCLANESIVQAKINYKLNIINFNLTK